MDFIFTIKNNNNKKGFQLIYSLFCISIVLCNKVFFFNKPTYPKYNKSVEPIYSIKFESRSCFV